MEKKDMKETLYMLGLDKDTKKSCIRYLFVT